MKPKAVYGSKEQGRHGINEVGAPGFVTGVTKRARTRGLDRKKDRAGGPGVPSPGGELLVGVGALGTISGELAVTPA